MKHILLTAAFLFSLSSFIHANGILVTDAQNAICLRVLNSIVQVSVDNQVAVVTSEQTFRNDFNDDLIAKYAFPLPEGAGATGLEWLINGEWHQAVFKPGPQDSSLPGPGEYIHPNIINYLGKTPVYFEITDSIKPDSSIVVRITYVQLLKYEFGTVKFNYPNNLTLLQSQSVDLQKFHFTLSSQRIIDSISMSSHVPQVLTNSGISAEINLEVFETSADKDYDVEYSLKQSELGLFSMSTSLPDSLVPDSSSQGFFLFIAEPNPPESSRIIKKVFTLIIDRSGSMYGEKMEQAKTAASFIVNHLNEGDRFNLIDFDDIITSFRDSHVPFTPANRDAALAYISTLYAREYTNISGAFGTAIPQFDTVNDSTANIIIFLTDGIPTAGMTDPEEILNYVRNLTKEKDSTLTIFNFGIGVDVNHQLLTVLARENNGIAEFLENNQLEDAITSFYLKIQNPVLLNTSMSFDPPSIVETYPTPLPSLYKGQQLLVGGRYTQALPVRVTLNGQAFGQPVSYSYQLSLSDSSEEKYRFLPKIWAKLKIEHLLVEYYSLPLGSSESERLKDSIVSISLAFGVLSPFTNLSQGGGTSVVEGKDHKGNAVYVNDFELLGNYPNPFNPGTNIIFHVNGDIYTQGTIRIYNMLGERVREIIIFINASGRYEIYWDGKDQKGSVVPSGSYIYVISVDNFVSAGKMNLMK